jgi:hypothetical protein
VSVAKSGDHPQESLAKFGYRTDMKVKNNLRMILCCGYLLLEIWWTRKY